ncbi:MAG TPA: twin-arginine translocase subunit TatC [Candidatus Polarisedimenticolia bacterium]|nr:twin-arginine translocase subunit TatC [Candidatus Polarisedimenticolia bacterium]
MPSPGTTPADLPTMTFLEHLDELRKRILRALLAVGIGFCVSLFYASRILDFLLEPVRPYLKGTQPVYLEITEPFLLYMKVAFLASLFLSSPFVLYQLWAFIAPGLYARERRNVVPFILFATVFFVLGGAFGYYQGFPRACDFLMGVAKGFQPALRISSLFSFESKIILGMGLVFELPTIIYFLSRLGLVTAGFLWRNFKYAILVIFIIAAVITPTPDVVTQCIFAGPMILLYLVGILVAHVFGRARTVEAEPEIPT